MKKLLLSTLLISFICIMSGCDIPEISISAWTDEISSLTGEISVGNDNQENNSNETGNDSKELIKLENPWDMLSLYEANHELTCDMTYTAADEDRTYRFYIKDDMIRQDMPYNMMWQESMSYSLFRDGYMYQWWEAFWEKEWFSVAYDFDIQTILTGLISNGDWNTISCMTDVTDDSVFDIPSDIEFNSFGSSSNYDSEESSDIPADIDQIIMDDLKWDKKFVKSTSSSCMNEDCTTRYSIEYNWVSYKYTLDSQGNVILKLEQWTLALDDYDDTIPADVDKIIMDDLKWPQQYVTSSWHNCFNYDCDYEYSITYKWILYSYHLDWEWSIISKEKSNSNKYIEVAKKELNVSDDEILDIDFSERSSSSSDFYKITFYLTDKILKCNISMSWKISSKEEFISQSYAEKKILKYLWFENEYENILSNNDEICKFRDFVNRFECDFQLSWNEYISYIWAQSGNFIPIKMSEYWVLYWDGLDWAENVITREYISAEDYLTSQEAFQVVLDSINKTKDNVKNYFVYSMWNWRHKIYNIILNSNEQNENTYYVDALSGNWVHSKREFITNIWDISWISKKEILHAMNDSKSGNYDRSPFFAESLNEMIVIYGFRYQDYAYSYTISLKDWSILDSDKQLDIWQDKAILLAKQSLQDKYGKTFEDDDMEVSYISLSDTEYFKYLWEPSIYKAIPQYVIVFMNESWPALYRAKVSIDWSNVQTDSFYRSDLSILDYGLILQWWDKWDLDSLSWSMWFSLSF